VGAIVASACGGSSDDPPAVPGVDSTGGKGHLPSGGTSGGGGEDTGATGTGADTGVSGDGSGVGGTGAMPSTDPAAPVVTITDPEGEDDPNGPGVIVERQVDVTCQAKPAPTIGATVEPSSVVIEMLDGNEDVVASLPGTPTTRLNEYSARFSMGDVPENGEIAFRCTAGDTSAPPLVSVDTVGAFVDHGPIVTFVEPAKDNQPVPLDKPLKIVFTVDESPVAKGDRGAKLGDISLTVRGQPIELTTDGNEYSATVNLNDQLVFDTAPDGSTLIDVTAANRRAPKPATRDENWHVLVDGTGPVIDIQSPPNESVRGGKVPLIFSVKDEQSGVAPDTIVVRLNSDPYPYSADDANWSVGSDGATYTFNFDTAQIQDSLVQATIDVTASDKVGNESKGSTLSLYLDDQPPIVDLDPPPVRESDKSGTFCSLAFDPVGPLAANDLDTVYQLKKFRALVWDETNYAEGQTILYYSGPDLNSVILRLQPKVEQGLLKDTNGDGICDELVDKDQDEPHELLPFQALTGIPPKGNSWFGPAGKDTLGADFPLPGGCGYQGAATAPEPLCPPLNSDDMTRVMSWDIDASIPAIFGIGSLQGIACTGTDWEIGPVVEEGWICVAGRAEDNTHNVGISRPLRLCFDDGVDPPPSCLDQDADPPPSCTIDCVPPPAFPSQQTFIKR
jgi:hypothetical protein